jgi:hypothetical protein
MIWFGCCGRIRLVWSSRCPRPGRSGPGRCAEEQPQVVVVGDQAFEVVDLRVAMDQLESYLAGRQPDQRLYPTTPGGASEMS